MPKQVRLRRGSTAQHSTFTGADGEVTFDTTKKVLVLHDGVTPGGKPLEGFLILNPGNPVLSQVINSIVSITGGDSESAGLSVVNGAEFSSISVTGTASLRNLGFQQENVAYGSNVTLNLATHTSKRLTLAGNVTFAASGMGFGRLLELRVLCDGSTRNLVWPAGWRWVGGTAPATIAAGKVGLLELRCYGTLEADVVARYHVEP